MSNAKPNSGSPSSPTSTSPTRTSPSGPSHGHPPAISPFVPTKSAEELSKLYTTLGPHLVETRKSIKSFCKGHWRKIADRKYVTLYDANLNTTQLLESTMNDSIPVWCKEIRLAQCTPRYKANLLERSLSIQRFLLRGGQTNDIYDENGGPTKNRYFAALYNLYIVNDVLYIFAVPRKGGSLHDRLKDRKSPLKPNQIRNWTRQLVHAVKAMHDYGIAHRALKLQHVMLHGSAHEVQVASWNRAVHFWDETTEPGHAYVLLQRRERRSRKNRHFPPECFSCLSYSGYDPSKVDLWSVGVIAVALSTGRYPFNPSTKFSFRAQWTAFVARHSVNEYLKDALHTLFEFDPQKRRPARKLLKNCKYFDASLDLDKLVNLNAESRRSLDASVPVPRPKSADSKATGGTGNKPKSKQCLASKAKTPLKRSESKGSKTSIKGRSGAGSKSVVHAKKRSRSTANQAKDSKGGAQVSRTTSKGSQKRSSSKTSVTSKNIKVQCSKSSTPTPASRDSKSSGDLSKSSGTKLSASSSDKSIHNTSKTGNSERPKSSSSGSKSYFSASNGSLTNTSEVIRSSSLPVRPKTAANSQPHRLEAAYDPGKDHAAGNEGGAVDEQLPPEEAKYESFASMRTAFDESETQARVVRVDVTDRHLRAQMGKT